MDEKLYRSAARHIVTVNHDFLSLNHLLRTWPIYQRIIRNELGQVSINERERTDCWAIQGQANKGTVLAPE